MRNRTVKRLKERYDRKRAERLAQELANKPFRDRVTAIFEAPRYVVTDFWCPVCKKDCVGTGYRQVCTVRDRLPTAWFTGFCPVGHRLVRRITDKDTDPYYNFSLMVQRQRWEHRDDLLTPNDPRFKEVYPEKWKELQAGSLKNGVE